MQVHPDDAFAQRHETESGYGGKSEAWVVLATEPGARIIYGLKRRIGPGELLQAARTGRASSS